MKSFVNLLYCFCNASIKYNIVIEWKYFSLVYSVSHWKIKKKCIKKKSTNDKNIEKSFKSNLLFGRYVLKNNSNNENWQNVHRNFTSGRNFFDTQWASERLVYEQSFNKVYDYRMLYWLFHFKINKWGQKLMKKSL